jgi:P27 family predicted phage terminase small subunit
MKKLAGNPGKRPLNENEPQPRAASARVPHGLTPGAQKYWRGMARDLIALEVLTVSDVPAFILMAEHYAVARQAAHDLVQDGKLKLTVIDTNGNERKAPLLQVLRDNAAAYRMFAVEFGMTPSSRGRIKVGPPEEEPDLATLLFQSIGLDVVGDDPPADR